MCVCHEHTYIYIYPDTECVYDISPDVKKKRISENCVCVCVERERKRKFQLKFYHGLAV